jgi:hypothetical protein
VFFLSESARVSGEEERDDDDGKEAAEATDGPEEDAEARRNMATLLAKFRIAVHDVVLIKDVDKAPSRHTSQQFREFLERKQQEEQQHTADQQQQQKQQQQQDESEEEIQRAQVSDFK